MPTTSLFPTCWSEFTVFANQWRLDSVLVVHEGESEPAFHAQHADTGGIFRIVFDLNYLVVGVHLGLDTATDAAIGACGRDGPDLLGRFDFEVDGPGGAGSQTRTAGGARRLDKGIVHERADASSTACSQNIYGSDELVAILAGLSATPAEDA